MRIDTKKFLFVGIHDEKGAFFHKAQDAGIIHFIDMLDARQITASSEVELIAHAIKVLRGLPPVDQEETDEFSLADGLAYKIVELKTHLEKLLEEKRMLLLEIARVGVFGNFSEDDIEAIEKESGRKIQFFCQKSGIIEESQVPDEAIYIATDMGLDYYMAINKEPVQYEKMIEMIIDRPLNVLKERLNIVIGDIRRTEERLKPYAKYNQFLHKALIYRLDRFHLTESMHYAEPKMEGELFAVEGWVPVSKLAEMEDLIKELHVSAEPIAIEEVDVAPTCLENAGIHRVGEDLVHIYDTPSNTDKDPSMWVLVWFSLFFAMIIGDAGYGLIFLATAMFIRYKFGQMKGAGLRFWKLMIILGSAFVGWGLVTSSFFGIPLDPTNPLREYTPLHWLSEKKMEWHIKNDTDTYHDMQKKHPELTKFATAKEALKNVHTEKDGNVTFDLADDISNGIKMEIALFAGILHVCLGYARYLRYTWAGIGWIIAIYGAYLYLPVYINAPSLMNYIFGWSFARAEVEGQYMLMIGFALAFALSIYQHKWLGLLEPTVVIQIFADILSYLRLYALGLAGGIISSIIFDFASQATIIVAVLLLLMGHLINITISIMGGVIHGLRLNFLEWYHYSFQGGGKRYDPLRKLAKEM